MTGIFRRQFNYYYKKRRANKFSALFLSGVSVQILYPNVDISSGSWLPSTGNNLWATIDESQLDIVDYDYSNTFPVANTFIVGLTDPSDPISNLNHNIIYVYGKDNPTGNIVLTVSLLENSTEIVTWVHNNISATPTTVTQTLTEVQADSITNYANLRLQFAATQYSV